MKPLHASLPCLLVPLALAALAAPPAAQAGTGGFRAGDLYLYSAAVDAISGGGGVVHIDPGTGDTVLLHDLATSVSAAGAICYDPFRDRLLFFGGFVPNSAELWTSDAAGNLQSLGFPTVAGPSIARMAPRGDGIVYMIAFNNPGPISYLDANDQIQSVMDAAGTTPYVFSQGQGGVYTMHYDQPTNQLVVASYSNLSDCPSEIVDSVSIFALQLSGDGTRVLGESCFVYQVAPGVQGEIPVGLAQGPDGDLILIVDTNDNLEDARMARIDLDQLTSTTFAWNDYFGDPATNAGTYSHVLGKAVILDTANDVLRAYSQGESGTGTIVASSGLSHSGSSGEVATLVQVHPTPRLFGLTTSGTQVSLSAGGNQPLELDFGAGQAGSLYLILGSATGWTPGLGTAPTLIPLNLDNYLLYTLFNPNTLPLSNSLGFLDPSGRASASFFLPAGTDPGLAGAVLHHAAAALNGSLVATQTSNAVPVELIP